MSDPRARFEELVEFPTLFTFRVVARRVEGLDLQVSEAASLVTGREVHQVTVQPSREGTYQAIRVTVEVHDATEIRSIYEAFRVIAGVLMAI